MDNVGIKTFADYFILAEKSNYKNEDVKHFARL